MTDTTPQTPQNDDQLSIAQRAIERLLVQLPTAAPDEQSAAQASRQPWAEVAAPPATGKMTLEAYLAGLEERLSEPEEPLHILETPSPSAVYLEGLATSKSGNRRKRKKKKGLTSVMGATPVISSSRERLPATPLDPNAPISGPASRNRHRRRRGGAGGLAPIAGATPLESAPRYQSPRPASLGMASADGEGGTGVRKRRRRRRRGGGGPPGEGPPPVAGGTPLS